MVLAGQRSDLSLFLIVKGGGCGATFFRDLIFPSGMSSVSLPAVFPLTALRSFLSEKTGESCVLYNDCILHKDVAKRDGRGAGGKAL